MISAALLYAVGHNLRRSAASGLEARVELDFFTALRYKLRVRFHPSFFAGTKAPATNEECDSVTQPIPGKFENVCAVCKANLYFDGKVVSHSLLFPDGSKKTLGLIYAGSFKFNTDAPERMEMVAGACRVKLAGQSDWKSFPAGTSFEVPGKSSFEIAVDEGIAEYICSFL